MRIDRRAITIRRAMVDDRFAICDLHIESIRTLCGLHYTAAQIEAWSSKTPEMYVKPIQEEFIVVAERDGTIIGFGELVRSKREIRALYLRPDAVGRGIGRLLLDALVQEAIAAQIPELTLNSTLNARSFYERCGFRTVCESSHCTADGTELPCIRMARSLDVPVGYHDGP